MHTQWHAGSGARTVEQFRAELVEIGRGQQLVVDPNELGHAPVNTADTGQDIAQDVIDQPFHRRQSNLHGKHTLKEKRAAVYWVSRFKPMSAVCMAGP